MTLEQRLQRAERNQRRLGFALALVVIGAIGLAAAPVNDTWEGQKIVLKSPDGGSQITLSADKNATGIWIGDQNKQAGKVDVALVDTTNGPALLMAAKDGKLQGITPANGVNVNDQNGQHLFRFYTTNAANTQPGTNPR